MAICSNCGGSMNQSTGFTVLRNKENLMKHYCQKCKKQLVQIVVFPDGAIGLKFIGK